MSVNYLPGVTIVDLSRWNPETAVDFSVAVSAGLTGVIAKLTQGGAEVDPLAITTLKLAAVAGVKLLGGYHFADQSADPVAEANHFMHVASGELGALSDVELMLDLEANGNSTMTVPQAEQFVSTVQAATGRWPWLYMGKYGPSGRGTGLPSKDTQQLSA